LSSPASEAWVRRWAFPGIWLALTAFGCANSGERWLSPAPAGPLPAIAVRSGAPVDLAQARGKVVLLTFGYTSCADICPTTLALMRRVLEQLGERADHVLAWYASIDPERDTPERFREFLTPFDPRIEGLAISAAQLPSVLQAYGVVARRRAPTLRRYVGRSIDPERDYSYDHTAALWLIDPQGRLRLRCSQQVPAARLAHDVEELLDG
jgi:protein SCO1/2